MVHAVIVAAGRGTRMGLSMNKVFARVGEMTVLERTVRTFAAHAGVDGGGNAGSMSTVDTPGMKAIRSAMWTGENTVMLICDVEDNSLSGMTGYVFYDTAEDKVLSYTQSQYEPIRQADGGILIPE